MGIDPTRGFVAFPRGLTEWEWYTESNTARLFFHLLLTANWQEKQWQGITIHPRRAGHQPCKPRKTAPDVRAIRPDGSGAPAINQLVNHPDRAEIQRYHAQ